MRSFNNADGMNYAPVGVPAAPVVGPGEFVFAAIGLHHGHIYGMCEGLLSAGGVLKWVYDDCPDRLKDFLKKYPTVKPAKSEGEIFDDREVMLVASACITADRAPLGIRAMNAGKDYFADKAPLTTLKQLEDVKKTIRKTGRKFAVYYSERLHVEAAVYAGDLIENGVIGKVIETVGLGPHRLNAPTRPSWFFEKERYGGILCDIGSHQIEQFLYYTGAKNAAITHSAIANYAHPQYPELDDFGSASLVADNGASGFFRVDWFTPDGLSAWGDGRIFILGTEGFIELRKNLDLAKDPNNNWVFFADKKGEHAINVAGKRGCPFFGQLILDCLNRTENAMTQAHTLLAAELCVRAQLTAQRLK
jgi:predicted dehydrogenase